MTNTTVDVYYFLLQTNLDLFDCFQQFWSCSDGHIHCSNLISMLNFQHLIPNSIYSIPYSFDLHKGCYLVSSEYNLTIVLRIVYYLTFFTFSFEFKESRLCDTRCLTQDVVSPHCGGKRMARRCTRSSLSNYFVMMSYHWNAGEMPM